MPPRTQVQPAPADSAPRPTAGEDSRERILDAAERLMSERGFAGTSISAIRRASGLPASSIYWHFESKEGLLAAVMERGAATWLERLRAGGEPALGPLLARALPDLKREQPVFLRLQLLLALERRDVDSETLETIRRVRGRALEFVREAIEVTLREAGQSRAREIALECALFARTFGDGLFIAQQIDADDVDLDALARQLELAIMAISAAAGART